ncbi:Enamine deaminase RidA, house cleaning of reactive enamine intermediates, YjgF/YER057c/UK114 family [Saccharopolyspora shandongensis]|uniref:Enamine deaminase RidA, house cleaning of reactive enamine intermediates, YjgF/YER057c/UK114 family n=1 Tax=Saccharopolyspora shandongensis TaxID=418495 RepID=A0A1H3D7W2_9PSEU|nr:RidA family protein [Saccharopolyspora shandongensis]SDX62457.1 Enamine deaminase RidA, house cleaning of reactive enamine intermediates, YjgF/YER057c/UK114 family [Saccharopolyspora shandongensis]
MTIERINPAELARPAGFSHAVVASDCRLVFLAGQTALDADGKIAGDGVVAQFRQALGNLLTALRAAGGSPEQVTELTVYIVDVDDYRAHAREIGAVWRELAGRDYPAMAGIGVQRLWDAEALVEIKGTAAIPAEAVSAP